MNLSFVIPARTALFIMLLMLLSPSAATAHELWLEPVAGGDRLDYGHRPGSHGGAARLDYAPDFVIAVHARDLDGKPVTLDWEPACPTVIPNDAPALMLICSSGHWCKTVRGTRNLSLVEAGQALASWLSLESVKRLNAWSEALREPLSDELELCPLNDPFTLRAGNKLRLLVTFAGKPVAGATVAYDGKPRGLSDENGRINLRVRHGGRQMIQAGLTLPLDSPDATETRHSTTLCFELEDSE